MKKLLKPIISLFSHQGAICVVFFIITKTKIKNDVSNPVGKQTAQLVGDKIDLEPLAP
jgi:hypothetical protein